MQFRVENGEFVNKLHLWEPIRLQGSPGFQNGCNQGNSHWFKLLLIAKQILLVSNIGDVKRAVWRIWMLMIGCEGI